MDFASWKQLYGVQKPVRYINQEWNSIHKNEEELRVSCALAFPDTYEVGMSHLGLKILYHLLNEQEGVAAERVFAPWVDLEQQLLQEGQYLGTLESNRPLKDFDVVGFSLQYELSYTNVLNMLHLGGIPLESAQRENWPMIIAGGPNTVNPEPLRDFVDCFFIGEGETFFPRFLRLIEEARQADEDKASVLKRLAHEPGVYVPALYDLQKEGQFFTPVPKHPSIPSSVTWQCEDLDSVFFPRTLIVPYTQVIHDRVTLEIARGCTRGCRFCQAGMLYRPVRERDTETLKELAHDLLLSTGYDEISLLSLSSSDYSNLPSLIKHFSCTYAGMGISVALPSLRADTFSVAMAKEVQKLRKTGLTFAPEAGSQRLRDVINKGVREEDLLKTVEAAFSAGWSNIKLYFMIGLPTETREDVQAIVDLVHKVRQAARKHASRRPQITVSISTFIPKPHTPFQWVPLLHREEVEARQRMIQKGLRGRAFKVQWHGGTQSFLEALFARGDGRLGPILKEVWEKGARFDAWSEECKGDIWEDVLAGHEYPYNELVYAPLSTQGTLPWSHIHTGINDSFLRREWNRAQEGHLTDDCRGGTCHGCGCCENLGMEMKIVGSDNLADTD